MGLLEDQTGIIFGATGRIGSVIAKTLSNEGAKVIVHYHRRAEVAHDLVTQIKRVRGTAKALQADVKDRFAVEALLRETAISFGAIHIVADTVHRSFDPKPVIDMSWTDWNIHLDALKGHFNICKSVLPYMREQDYGRIVYISGGLSYRYFRGCSAYTAIKAGLNGFCKTLALEEGEHNITVNIVAPGKIVPKGRSESEGNAEAWNELGKRSMSENPLKRFATADDVANAVLYFVSPKASCITGQTLFVAGGEIMP